MLDIGWPELLVVAIVLIVVVGPKDLPPMLRAFGRTTKKLRGMASEFRGQFDEALREAELDDVKKTFDEARKLNPMNNIRDAVNPLKDTAKEIRSDLEKTVNSPSAPTEPQPKVDIPPSSLKLADGPPEIKSPEPAAAAAASKTAAKAAPAKAKTAKAPAKAKPAATRSASAKTATKSTAKAKPAAAKSAPRAKKPKKGEGQA